MNTPVPLPAARRRLAAACLVLAAACSPATGPPEIVVDRTACARCSMLVSETRFAAAYRMPDGTARTFDDIGCLLAELAERDVEPMVVWVRAYDSDAWLNASEATFVRGAAVSTPMSGGLVGFAREEAARDFVAEYGGEVLPDPPVALAGNGAR